MSVQMAAAQSCPGDCNGDRQVSIAELVRGVRIALGEAPLANCPVADSNGDGSVTVSDLIAAVLASLGRCLADTPTPTVTPVGGPLCGDGTAEAPEECDDGGVVGGDGCSATCQLEPGGNACAGVPITDSATLRAELVATGLLNPLQAAAPPLDPNRLFVVEQPGRVRLVKTTAQGRELLETPFLDITDRVRTAGGNDERGLLGIAFHPDYENNGWFFVNYTCRAPNCPEGFDDSSTVISRFTRSANPDRADLEERVVLAIDQPFANHNGGQLAFGPDGYMYVGMGDGGSGFDPQGNAQNDSTLLGKMLRIDVSPVDAPYWRVPNDNPTAGRGELSLIWAKGLRNPWRFSFDRANGDLYIGDVGQRSFEEIDVQPADSTGGENYGWDIYEANSCVDAGNCPDPDLFIRPVVQYGRAEGISVTGGFVYRGCAIPSLRGNYFYSDFGSGFIRTFVLLDGTATQRRDRTNEIAVPDGLDIQFPASYGEDARGELYIVDRDGDVFQLVAGN